ncbi:hypothetical protein K435DRAFT_846698 [Dendrothele bispora CBS 962.96]|uniref:Uncharacterized protein n=1 Tax=Dendrothele bispora (strain CBS 962.96) TaxID=1314807 RepID=A0A4S8KKY2_DENBC|nr:hypothetical protein K435DRAFT_846698 [Dendrothele bispora CBS 962.96]
MVNGTQQLLTPQDILTYFFSVLKTKAEDFYNDTISHSIITIPPYLTDPQREVLMYSLTQANLSPLRLMYEPGAVLRAYESVPAPSCCSCSPDELEVEASRYRDINILVYDLKEDGRFEATVYWVEDTIPELLVNTGTTNAGVELVFNVGESLTEAVVERTIEISLEAMRTAESEEKYFKGGIHEILLSGKASLNPLVRQMLSAAFPEARIPSIPFRYQYQHRSIRLSEVLEPSEETNSEGSAPDTQVRIPSQAVNPDPEEAIVIGASVYASVLTVEPSEENIGRRRRKRRRDIPTHYRKKFDLSNSEEYKDQNTKITAHYPTVRRGGDLSEHDNQDTNLSAHKFVEIEVSISVEWESTPGIIVDAKNLVTNSTVSISIVPPPLDSEEIERMILDAYAEEFAEAEALRRQLEDLEVVG